ncbi:MAG: glycosyltransferase [Cyanothece sp. SIO2G6]|nr:glycosyltransferase [Cyanothece sp. SIO2G6]
MQILMLSSTFPYPPTRGGTEVRTFNLLRYLQNNHDVTLVTQRSPDTSEDDITALKAWVTELILIPSPPAPQQPKLLRPLYQIGRLVRSFAVGIPPNVLHRYSQSLQAWIDQHVQSGKFDVITCEHGVNAVYIRPEFQRSLKTVLNAHSMGYRWTLNHLQMNASAHVWRDRLYLPIIHRYEKRHAQQFSTIIVTTPEDQEELKTLCPHTPAQVIPNGVDLDLFPYREVDPGGQKLVFVGAMDSDHNIEGARFFVTEVMPQLRQRYPELTLDIVGARPNATAQALGQAPGVTVTGRVPSVVDYLHQAVVCVVPLRTGFGIKNKTLEAMAAGVPVVGSDRGLEGLNIDNMGTSLYALRANRPEDYVTAVSQLLDNPQLRQQISQKGRSLVESTFTWEQAGKRYEQALAQDRD